jgi:hypothetical protein
MIIENGKWKMENVVDVFVEGTLDNEWHSHFKRKDSQRFKDVGPVIIRTQRIAPRLGYGMIDFVEGVSAFPDRRRHSTRVKRSVESPLAQYEPE